MIYFESLWNVVLHLTLQIFKNINVFHCFHQQAGGDLKGDLGAGLIRVHEVVTHPAVSFQKEVDAFLDVVLELIDAREIKEFAEAEIPSEIPFCLAIQVMNIIPISLSEIWIKEISQHEKSKVECLLWIFLCLNGFCIISL